MAAGRILPGDTFRRLVAARDFIDSCHAEPLELARMAACAGMSRYHFLRLFQRAFGVTPHEQLTRVRLARARVLLERGEASVTEACFDVGYSSLGSFSTLFARRFGCSPMAYQRRVRRFVAVPAQLPRLYIPCCFLDFFGPAQGSQSSRSLGGAAMVPVA